jgi:hypothetical protein
MPHPSHHPPINPRRTVIHHINMLNTHTLDISTQPTHHPTLQTPPSSMKPPQPPEPPSQRPSQAFPGSFTIPGAPARATEEFLTALRKGTSLRKYGRRGSPKYHHFRLSADDKELQWLSSNVSGSRGCAVPVLGTHMGGTQQQEQQQHGGAATIAAAAQLREQSGGARCSMLCMKKRQ